MSDGVSQRNLGTMRLQGVSEFNASVDEMAALLDVATKKATVRAAAAVERRIKQKLKQTAHKRGTKTPSAPGDPPSTVDGTLARSITVDGPEMVGFGNYTAAVGSDGVAYSRVQELGGDTGRGHATKLPARPYTLNSLDEMQDRISRIASEEWHSVLDLYAGP